MNTDKLMPIDFSRKITPFVIGDVLDHEIAGRFTLELSDQVAEFNKAKDSDREYSVVSFADRPNTGTQPVGDDIMVDVNLDTAGWHIFECPRLCCWGEHTSIKSWKPNHAAMLKQHQAEQAKQKPNEVDVIEVESRGELSGWFAKEKEPPTFTQAMADAWEFPPIGSEANFECEGWGNGAQWCKFHGKALCGGYIIEFHHDTSPTRTTVDLFDPELTTFKPIQTDEDKLKDAIMDYLDCDAYMAQRMMFAPKFTITLNKG